MLQILIKRIKYIGFFIFQIIKINIDIIEDKPNNKDHLIIPLI